MTKRFPMWCIRWLAGAVAAFAALPGHAAWEPAGAFQVASMKVMTPQISALASKAKFPLLPMLIPQVIAQNPFAERFGMPREDTDWGMKFYVNGETFRSVVVWPLGEGGVEAWRKAHPKATLKDGLYTFSVELPGMSEEGAKVKCRAAFTADGKWACIADDGDLAKRVAGNDPAFDTPLAKGICCLVLEDPSRFGKAAAFLEKLSESMKEDEDSGDDGDNGDSGDIWKKIDCEASGSPVGANGVMFHPYLQGERCPYWDPNLRASFTGVSISSTRGDFVRALMEGVAFSLRDCYRTLEEMSLPAKRIFLIGGGARSRPWSEIVANVFNRPVSVPEPGDASFGAALLAGVGAGVFSDEREAVAKCLRISRRIEPDAAAAAEYAGLFACYRRIHDALAPVYRSMAGAPR